MGTAWLRTLEVRLEKNLDDFVFNNSSVEREIQTVITSLLYCVAPLMKAGPRSLAGRGSATRLLQSRPEKHLFTL